MLPQDRLSHQIVVKKQNMTIWRNLVCAYYITIHEWAASVSPGYFLEMQNLTPQNPMESEFAF